MAPHRGRDTGIGAVIWARETRRLKLWRWHRIRVGMGLCLCDVDPKMVKAAQWCEKRIQFPRPIFI